MVDTPDSSRTVHTEYETIFLHEHDVERDDLRRLYENAKRDQWNVSTDIDWDTPLDSQGGFIADGLIDIYDTEYWHKMNDNEQAEMNRLYSAWRLSQLFHGEHGATLLCSQLTNVLPNADTKYFMTTQVIDEGRHTEFFQRYLGERVCKVYPQSDTGRELFDYLLADPRWYTKTIGLQLVAETFAVALFKMLAETAKDELLRTGCQLILRDEARHMGFGMLSLPAVVEQFDAKELEEVEDFTVFALHKTLGGGFPKDVYLDMGFTTAQVEEIRQVRRQKAASSDNVIFRQLFKREMHSTLINNLHRCGILSESMKGKLEGELRVNVAEYLAAD